MIRYAETIFTPIELSDSVAGRDMLPLNRLVHRDMPSLTMSDDMLTLIRLVDRDMLPLNRSVDRKEKDMLILNRLVHRDMFPLNWSVGMFPIIR